MAKNKVMIDVIVDDKGTTKRVAVDAKKLGVALDSTAKSARSTDRQLKGTAQASANSTKNFSKMAQGISGGLVPAYAAFAAQIFALSAAFNFLKRAADLENLRKSQVAYSQSTGAAVNTITTRLQQASQGMLGFQEAAQSAAIGAAKGFSSSQLEKLAEGSVKLSNRLGRSYEDTYDRLVRGISKAEPELLDELGITLRLETATRKYADALGVNVKTLTEAQRSQAVYNEAVEQMNRQTVGSTSDANVFQALLKTLEEIQQKITEKVLPLFSSLADFINKNADAAAVAFTALGALILVNITGLTQGVKGALASIFTFAGSSVGLVGKTASLTGKLIGKALDPVIEEIKEAEDKLLKAAKDSASKARSAAKNLVGQGAKSTTLQKIAEGIEVTPQALGKLRKDLARVKEEIKETGETASEAFKGATVESIEAVEKELKTLGRTSLTTGQKIKKGMAVIGVGGVKLLRGSVTLTSLAFANLGKGAKIAGGAINKAMSLAMKGTFILAGIQAAYELFLKLSETPYTFLKNIETVAKKVIKVFESIINFVLAGANKLLEALGLEIRIPKADLQFLVDNIENYSDKALEALGTSREQLKVREDENNKAREQIALQEEINEKFKQRLDLVRALANDFENATLETFEQKATFISGIDIQEQLRAYTDLKERIQKEVEAGNSLKTSVPGQTGYAGLAGISENEELKKFREDLALTEDNIRRALAIFPKLQRDILKELGDGVSLEEAFADPELFERLVAEYQKKGQVISGAYLSGLSGIRQGLPQLMTDLRGGSIDTAARSLSDMIDKLVKPADRAAMSVNELSVATKELNDALGVDATTLLKTLQELQKIENAAQDALNSIAVKELSNRQLPGAVGRQASLQTATERAQQELILAENSLSAFQEANSGKGGLIETDPEAYEDQIRKLQQTIALATESKRIAERNLTEIGQLGNAVGDSLASSMQSAFEGLIQGTMSAKEAFASMAKSMLQAIAKVIAELLVAKLLTAALGGTSFGTFLGIPARTGGIFEQDPSMRYGGVAEKVQAYAGGGIAKGRQAGYPAILHGTEAVVPLPNGKEIPVQMTKGSGSTNNVVVNVTVDSNGNAQQNTSSSTNQGAGLGNAIALAVQKELQNQKRSGGILNPYGAA